MAVLPDVAVSSTEKIDDVQVVYSGILLIKTHEKLR